MPKDLLSYRWVTVPQRVGKSLLELLCSLVLASEHILVVRGPGIKDGALQGYGVGMVGVRHIPCRLMPLGDSIAGVGHRLTIGLVAASARPGRQHQHDI